MCWRKSALRALSPKTGSVEMFWFIVCTSIFTCLDARIQPGSALARQVAGPGRLFLLRSQESVLYALPFLWK